MNKEMIDHREIDNEKSEGLVNAFKKAISLNKALFGEHSFKRFYPGDDISHNGRWSTKFNYSLYDVMMFGFAKEDKNRVYQNLD
jgi:hypothetical protein